MRGTSVYCARIAPGHGCTGGRAVVGTAGTLSAAGVAGLAVVDVLLFAVGDVPALEHFVRSAGADDVNRHNDATRKPLSAMAAKDFIAAALVPLVPKERGLRPALSTIRVA
jgi:hypothetical protein